VFGFVNYQETEELPLAAATPFVSQFWKFGIAIDPVFYQPSTGFLAPDNSAVLSLLTAQKIHGAGGQVQQKFWRYDYDSKDYEPSWYGPPGFQSPDGAAPLNLLTFQKIHGAGGQVQQKFWRYDYDAKDYEPSWYGAPGFNAPDGAAPLNLLTAQKIHGAGGQVQQKFWRYDYAVEFPQWQGAPRANVIPQFFARPFAKLWRYEVDTSTLWTWQPPQRGSFADFFGNEGQAPTKFWRYDIDVELRAWQWQQQPFSAPLTLAKPFATLPLQYQTALDTQPWQGVSLAMPFPFLFPTKTNVEWILRARRRHNR